jgi:uroporphyrinogen-III synthase
MNEFKDFGIALPQQEDLFVGDKIKIERIMNRQITVHKYEVRDSKFKGKYLCLQISIGEEKRIVFSSSISLINIIERVPKTGFPFATTIIKENERFQFT